MVEKRILAVLDTNVFVSGLLSPGGTPGVILAQFKHDAFDLATSKAQVREVISVLKRSSLARAVPAGTTKEVLKFFLAFKKLTQVYDPPKLDWEFEDLKDHFLLDLAVEAKADFLVTGDRKLKALALIEKCAVVSPAEFLIRI